MPRASKKAVIQAWLERQQPACVGPEEAAAIRREVVSALGPQARLSDDYLLSVLAELGASVAPELGGLSAEVRALLHFGTLEAAETTLRTLDQRYRRHRAASEREAAAQCRRAALLVRRRAERIARARKVDPAKRAQKEEIARWFAIWLQTPDLFFDWLELRKQTEEFRRMKNEK